MPLSIEPKSKRYKLNQIDTLIDVEADGSI